MNRIRRVGLVVMVCLVAPLFVLACSSSPGPAPAGLTAPAAGQPSPPSTAAGEEQPAPTDARAVRPTPAITSLPERVPAEMAPVVTSAVPAALLDEIVAGLAAAQGIAAGGIEIVRAEAVTWADGSLGCPEPGMNYLMVPVDGYWVVLRHGGRTFDYRATDTGSFRLCPDPAPGPAGTPRSVE